MNNLKEAKEWLSQLILMRSKVKKGSSEYYVFCSAILDAKFYFQMHYRVHGGKYAEHNKLQRKVDVHQFSYGLFCTTVKTTTLTF